MKAVQSLPEISRIIVVNDGSTDETADIVRSCGIELLDLDRNIGKGGAMNAGARMVDSDIVVFLDADLGPSALEASKIISPVLIGQADLAVAALPEPRSQGRADLVKKTAAWAIWKASGLESIAPMSGQRAMTRQVLEAVLPFNDGYGVELGMSIRTLMKGFRLLEVPTTMVHRESGRDMEGFMHRGKLFLDILRTSMKELKGK